MVAPRGCWVGAVRARVRDQTAGGAGGDADGGWDAGWLHGFYIMLRALDRSFGVAVAQAEEGDLAVTMVVLYFTKVSEWGVGPARR
ncbi:hypothetical protein OPT61_g9437 [Boeremia exigua]|uniref:Uncharacterized protein n=1 Tax=Boeremia exigua TaxID=749465 RepID=A0ACC2HU33_9PLEO|nr:hypothetical protein OPT61_g9437 [Boeremia exigua]